MPNLYYSQILESSSYNSYLVFIGDHNKWLLCYKNSTTENVNNIYHEEGAVGLNNTNL